MPWTGARRWIDDGATSAGAAVCQAVLQSPGAALRGDDPTVRGAAPRGPAQRDALRDADHGHAQTPWVRDRAALRARRGLVSQPRGGGRSDADLAAAPLHRLAPATA